MLPLSPPPGYFKEINSIISKFIWNDKCPRIKLTTLQHPNSAGGLAVPNFELYYWSFQLKALHNWVDSQSTVSWRVIEADKVKPNRLQDILFTGTGKKWDNYKFGPIVANSIKIWKTVERRIGGHFKVCNSTPLWHNFNFVCGNRQFVQPSWSSLGAEPILPIRRIRRLLRAPETPEGSLALKDVLILVLILNLASCCENMNDHLF